MQIQQCRKSCSVFSCLLSTHGRSGTVKWFTVILCPPLIRKRTWLAGLLTQQLSCTWPHHSAPAGPCLYCTSGLKHDRLAIQADGFGKDTTGQGWTTSPTQASISHHNYRFTCRQTNQAEHQYSISIFWVERPISSGNKCKVRCYRAPITYFD